MNAGLIDQFSIALSPVLFGSGIRLFEGVDADRVALEPVRAEPSPKVMHLTYAVRERYVSASPVRSAPPSSAARVTDADALDRIAANAGLLGCIHHDGHEEEAVGRGRNPRVRGGKRHRE